MAYAERTRLVAEKNFLSEQLEKTPVAALLTRRSLESRLESVRALIEELPDRPPAKRTFLTFKGKPVKGSEGIAAQFGSDALRAFSDAVSAVAASLQAPLKSRGPIRNNNRLLLTGTALGSFGFELEEVQPTEENPAQSVTAALDKTQELLAASQGNDDDRLANAVQAMDPRALENVRKFLTLLDDNEAAVTIARPAMTVSFADVAQVHSSLERLAPTNVHESFFDLKGIFVGVLPQNRQFEFREEGEVEVIYGKIALSIEEPGLLTGHWGNRFDVKIKRVQVGNAKPTFTLISAQRSLTTSLGE